MFFPIGGRKRRKSCCTKTRSWCIPIPPVLLFLGYSLDRWTCEAQQFPLDVVKKFDRNTSYRTNICDRQLMLWNGTLELPLALSGLQLSVSLTNYQEGKETYFFSLTEGHIPMSNPGLFAVILDELAKRAEFEWRNSFFAYPPLDPLTDGNKTWTDILTWAIDTFDIAMERWAYTPERLNIPASFPLGWYDNSIVLAELIQKSSQNKTMVNLWSFLDPFHPSLWGGVVLAIIVTGIVYWVLEIWNVDADERQLECKPVASIFYAAITFTGHYELRPQTHPARLVGFSFTFWALIVASSYIANLAGFLVSPRVVVFKYSTIDDVRNSKAYVCVQEGGAISKVLASKYPGMRVVPKSPDQAIFEGLRLPHDQGGCDVIAHQYNTYEIYEHLREVNEDCAMQSQRKVVEIIPAGLATAVDPGAPYCTSLISHVLDYHLTTMLDDGFLDRTWKSHLDRIATVDCAANAHVGATTVSEDDTLSLTIQEVGGIFIVHVVVSALAIAFATFQFYQTHKRGELVDDRTLSKAFGISQAREKLEKHSSLFNLKEASLRSTMASSTSRTASLAHNNDLLLSEESGMALTKADVPNNLLPTEAARTTSPFAHYLENLNVVTNDSLFFDEEVHS
jgi:Ligand-gated ion channel